MLAEESRAADEDVATLIEWATFDETRVIDDIQGVLDGLDVDAKEAAQGLEKTLANLRKRRAAVRALAGLSAATLRRELALRLVHLEAS